MYNLLTHDNFKAPEGGMNLEFILNIYFGS